VIKTIIIDDDLNSSETLEKMLIRYFPNKFIILKICSSIDEAVEQIPLLKPELVFLDVQMPVKNGFTLFKELKEIEFEVIFTTAHAEYAIEAIKCSALDYLLKPINYLDLLDAVKRFENKTYKNQLLQRIELLVHNTDSGEAVFRKIAISTETGYEFVKLNKIIYLEAQNNYTKFYLSDQQTILASKTLKHFESLLPSDLFFRIHKSYLVNLNLINRYAKGDDQCVELITGQRLPVSFRKKDEFLHAIIQKPTS
jgi:two-component system LytT family response regulator